MMFTLGFYYFGYSGQGVIDDGDNDNDEDINDINNILQELNGQSQTTVFSSQASANPCFVQCLLTCFKTSGKPIKRISYNVIG